MNNYDKITSMNPRELANFMSSLISCKGCFLQSICNGAVPCSETIETWLESEVQND